MAHHRAGDSLNEQTVLETAVMIYPLLVSSYARENYELAVIFTKPFGTGLRLRLTDMGSFLNPVAASVISSDDLIFDIDIGVTLIHQSSFYIYICVYITYPPIYIATSCLSCSIYLYTALSSASLSMSDLPSIFCTFS